MKHRLGLILLLLMLAFPLMIMESNAQDSIFEPYKEKGIIVAQEATMPPMSFKDVNGHPKGYIIDLWRKWSAETGVPVHFYLTDWVDTITAVRAGTADVHGGLFYSAERDKYFDYTMPFFPSTGAFFSLRRAEITDLSFLKGRPVGVILQSFYDGYIRKEYPAMKPVPVRTSAELVDMALRGEVDAFLADYPTLMSQIGSMGKGQDFRVTDVISEQEFRAAVAQGNEQLLAMIEQGLSLVDEEERHVILNRWIINEDANAPSWLLPTVIISISLLLLAVILPFVVSRLRN